MIRSSFIILLLISIITKAQTDVVEKIEVPYQKSDFLSILTFWKQINSIKTTELLKMDSIKFYKDDTLKYTYHLDAMKSFERKTVFADSVINASTDSTYNKEQNSYDFYFTDVGLDRSLTHRKYLDNKGQYYKVEQFSEGIVTMRTTRIFDDQGRILEEVNDFIEDKSKSRITYTRNGAWISEKRLVLKRRGNAYDIVITFNDRGAIIAYIYKGAVDNYSLTIKRGKDNLASEINGFVNNDAVSFGFSYSFGMVEVVRENAMGIKNTFKLVMY